MEELLRFLARCIVNDPESIEVSTSEEERRLEFQLRVAQEDMGRVIGKNGKTVNAIRSVMKAASVKAEKKVSVEVLE
jgi:predicted RNA-binding protein YlqC (UPF0109 family)